ncbi:MAG: DUF2877 domain-containing protein [Chloroflexi bacterium]|nr:DUF2877 domain-containing protein [Chloroflexota bacterium]
MILKAVSLAPAARAWLESSGEARVLHVFTRACNLLDSHDRLLSLVAEPLGNGPFSLVVEEVDFTRHIQSGSPVSRASGPLVAGTLQVNWQAARLWSPRPAWEAAAARLVSAAAGKAAARTVLLELLRAEAPSDSLAALLHRADPQLAASLAARARRGMEDLAHPGKRADAARALAGLGPGLTPAGDDFLLGFMHAFWAHNPAAAAAACQPLADAAAPLTGALSRVWLRSAARGEAGEPWHRFLKALADGDQPGLLAAAEAILPTGHTSGADALAGFVFGLEAA